MTMFANIPYVFTFTIKNFKDSSIQVTTEMGQSPATVMVSGRGSDRLPAVLVNSDSTRHPCSSFTTLSASISATATSMTVASAGGMLAGRLLVIDDEVVNIVSVSVSTVQVQRASDSSVALSHVAGAPVCLVQAGGRRGMADPLALWKRGVVLAKIGQSTPLPEATNTITVTIVSNVDIDNNAESNVTKFSIYGLTGTTTADTSALTLTDIQNSGTAAYFGATAGWNMTTGTLELTQAIFTKILAGNTLIFSFSVKNGANEQLSPAIFFRFFSTRLIHTGKMDSDTQRIPVVPCASRGDGAPLRILRHSMCMKLIAQSTPFPGALNTICVSLTPTVSLSAVHNSKVTIHGLRGTQTADSNALAITDVGSSGANTLFGKNASWTKANGTLVLTVAASQIFGAGQTVSFSFQVTNPAPKSSAVAIFVSTSGSRQLGPERMVVQDEIAPFSANTILSQDVHDCAYASVYVASASAISAGSVLQIDNELMRVIALSGTNITVTRAQDGTSPSSHKSGALVYVVKPGCSIGSLSRVLCVAPCTRPKAEVDGVVRKCCNVSLH
jgi:hypothetical protein